MAEYDPSELGRDSTRRRAARLIKDKPLIKGSLVTSLRTCGDPTCHCHHDGIKHSATYLGIRYDKKRIMVYVPESVLAYVQECVTNYQNLQQALDILSRDCVENFLLKKHAHKKKSV